MDSSIKKDARRAGIIYFAFVITCMFGGIVRSNLIVLSDAAKTAELLRDSEWLLRISSVVDLISGVLFLVAAWALYVLLKPVDKNIAMLFLLLNAAGVAVQCNSLLNSFAPMLISGSEDMSKVFAPDQLDALNLMYLNLHKSGFTIAQIFFGAWLLPLSYLVYRSGFLPKWLGILLFADFFGVMIWFFQYFLLPDYEIMTYPGFVVSFIAEISLSLWLMIKGVKEQKPTVIQEIGRST